MSELKSFERKKDLIKFQIIFVSLFCSKYQKFFDSDTKLLLLFQYFNPFAQMSSTYAFCSLLLTHQNVIPFRTAFRHVHGIFAIDKSSIINIDEVIAIYVNEGDDAFLL